LNAIKGSYNAIQDNISEDFFLKMSRFTKKRLTQKLRNIELQINHNMRIVSEYRFRITTNIVSHPKLSDDNKIVFVRYPLIAQNKPKLLEKARKMNIELADWYVTPVHPIPRKDWSLVHYEAGSCPNAEAICNQVVTLPTYSKVKKSDIDRTVDFFNEALLEPIVYSTI
jgi:dTDP-4-amino-4,6-dideoxygalactose transaminase